LEFGVGVETSALSFDVSKKSIPHFLTKPNHLKQITLLPLLSHTMALFLQTTFLTSSSSLRQKPCLSSWASHISTSRTRTRTRVHAKIREIFMPALSSTMTEGKIVSWVKSEGDKLSKGESVVVVESDKADMDVETFYDGYLAAIMVEEGGVAAVGSAIALLAESPEEIEEAKSKAASSSPATSPAPAVAAAPVSESTTGSGAVEKAVVVTPPSPSVVASAVHPASEGGKRVVASPYAKKLAKDLKVDLGRVIGSGPNGRIVAKDVEAAAAVAAELGSPAAKFSAAPAVQAPPGIELGSVVPFTTMQGAVCRNMVESLSVPTFRVGYTITTDALDALYKKVSIVIEPFFFFSNHNLGCLSWDLFVGDVVIFGCCCCLRVIIYAIYEMMIYCVFYIH
jgi:pyruvate dehydrogenase E2 component (dihydrolipoamide acetyltransferase)